MMQAARRPHPSSQLPASSAKAEAPPEASGPKAAAALADPLRSTTGPPVPSCSAALRTRRIVCAPISSTPSEPSNVITARKSTGARSPFQRCRSGSKAMNISQAANAAVHTANSPGMLLRNPVIWKTGAPIHRESEGKAQTSNLLPQRVATGLKPWTHPGLAAMMHRLRNSAVIILLQFLLMRKRSRRNQRRIVTALYVTAG